MKITRLFFYFLLLIVFPAALINCKKSDDELPIDAAYMVSPEKDIQTIDTVRFTSTSTPDSRIVEYSWDFGDGTPTSNAKNPIHFFRQAGTYTVVLTVRGNRGDMDLFSRTFTVKRPPTGSLTLWRRAPVSVADITVDTFTSTDTIVWGTKPVGCQSKTHTFTLPEGTYTATARHRNTGATWSRQVNIVGGECMVLEYMFNINTRVSVTVNDTLGKPVPNASVLLYGSYTDLKLKRNPVTSVRATDVNGNALFQNMQPLTYWVAAEKSKAKNDSTAVKAEEGGLTEINTKIR